ncbi:MAG: hypothetical protein Q4D11_04630 [Rhodospirillales bacterium]|nr:hypothetical protein [Rhodospirillales bacterium]
MKELSFLMFLIALAAIFIAFCNRVLRLNPRKLVYFYIPDTARFNVIWGFMFYAAYGILIAKTLWLKIAFAVFIALLLMYLFYLYAMKNFLSGHYTPLSSVLEKIIITKLDAQKKLDIKIGDSSYLLVKSLKMLGLPAFAVDRPDMILKKINMLKKLQSSMQIRHSYLATIIKKLTKSLNCQ